MANKWKTKEQFDTYFEVHIRVHCKNNELPKFKEIIKLGHGPWLHYLYSYYTGLRDFSEKNGLLVVRTSKINNLLDTKEKFDQYFNDKIRIHCIDGKMPPLKELISKKFSTWVVSLHKNKEIHGYQGI